MFCPVIIFTMFRSGGSYLSQVLSAGRPILTEPSLPSDAPGVSLKESMERLQKLHEDAKECQVIKICQFGAYLDLLQDRKISLPEGFAPVCLFRHPFNQIASQLYVFDNWADRWTSHAVFFNAIESYRAHVRLCRLIQQRYPEAQVLRYEDTLGEGLEATLEKLFGKGAQDALPYAEEVRNRNYKLGPVPEGEEWEPGEYELSKREKVMVAEALEKEMAELGYSAEGFDGR